MTRTAILQGCIDRIKPYCPCLQDARVNYDKGCFWVRGAHIEVPIASYDLALAWIALVARDKRPNMAMIRVGRRFDAKRFWRFFNGLEGW